MAKRGRPSKYTDEIADEICSRLAHGESLNRICEAEGMPAESRVREWADINREGFTAKYARARASQAEHYAQEVIDIADGATDANLARVRVDARKWVAARLLPRVWGDKQQHEHSGEVEIGVKVIELPPEQEPSGEQQK